MATGGSADPTRATFIAILQQLNRAESIHEGRDHDQALYLDDLHHALRRFWAVDEQKVKLPLALGLLVRNGLVRIEVGGQVPARGRPSAGARYRITSQGKQFLVEATQKSDRIA
jgi:hypothetical protein